MQRLIRLQAVFILPRSDRCADGGRKCGETPLPGEGYKVRHPAAVKQAVVEQKDNNRNRTAARGMLAVAVGMTAVVALVLSVVAGGLAARSAVLGGLVFVLPNALFVSYFFRHGGTDSAAAVRGLFIGETLKLLATVALFAAAFLVFSPINAAALLGTYLFLLLVNLAGNACLMR